MGPSSFCLLMPCMQIAPVELAMLALADEKAQTFWEFSLLAYIEIHLCILILNASYLCPDFYCF